jgi:hypothetical protein
VVIDEVHNFISAVINNPDGLHAKLHEAMCRSDTIKIVALSGTPFLNHPREVAYLMNLVKGYTVIHDLEFEGGADNNIMTVRGAISGTPGVDFIENVNFSERRISIRLFPGSGGTDAVERNLRDIGLNVIDVRKRYVQLIPQDEATFMNLFMDPATGKFKNHDMFLRRIMGAVSFYDVHPNDKQLYPTLAKEETVRCEMSAYQASKYAGVRTDEIKKEKMSAIRQGGDTGQVYKTFSRIACNFVFPEEVKRPFKSMGHEGDYGELLEKAIQDVAKNSKKFLRDDLRKYSCKFAEIMTRIAKSPGCILVYSNYRRVEGVRLFSEVLRANGYTEFDELYSGEVTSDMRFFVTFEGQQNIIDVFNGKISGSPLAMRIAKAKGRGQIIDVIMITQSGAEGITLLNVRQVHIMEPHWNNIRHDQVIGRAVRTCSHSGLPKDQRTVEVYRYIAKLPQGVVIGKDGAKTVDDLILDMSVQKAQVTEDILNLLKIAAIDCSGDQCMKFNGGGVPQDLAYDIDLDIDAMRGSVDAAKTKKKYQRVDVQGVRFLMDPVTHELFDSDMTTYKGKLVKTDSGAWTVI